MLDPLLVHQLSKRNVQDLISDLDKYFHSGYLPMWLGTLMNEDKKRYCKEVLLMDIEWYIIRTLNKEIRNV